MTNKFEFIAVADVLKELKSEPKLPTPAQVRTLAQYVDPEEDATDLVEFLMMTKVLKREEDWTKHINFWKRERHLSNELGGVPEGAPEFIELLAIKWKVEIYINSLIMRDGVEYPYSELERDIRLENVRLGLDSMIKESHIRDALDAYKSEQIRRRRAEMKAKIAYDPTVVEAAEVDWQTIDREAFDSPAPGFVAAALKKFIYQVKRKQARLKIENHLMPILYGPQGRGKSSFIKDTLLAPVNEVTANTTFMQILDDKSNDLWQNNVLYLEEMKGATRADMAAVKQKVTADFFNQRKLYTNATDRVTNHTTMIGDSNEPVAQLLVDPSGMRRFVELKWKCRGDAKAVWAALASVDSLRLWRSIDENGPDPMTPFEALLKDEQEELRTEDVVEQWLRDLDRDDNRKLDRRWDSKLDQYVVDELPTWENGQFKKAADIYVHNFEPWRKQMAAQYTSYSFQKWSRQMNTLFDHHGEKLGLRKKAPQNKMHWAIGAAEDFDDGVEVVEVEKAIDPNSPSARLDRVKKLARAKA